MQTQTHLSTIPRAAAVNNLPKRQEAAGEQRLWAVRITVGLQLLDKFMSMFLSSLEQILALVASLAYKLREIPQEPDGDSSYRRHGASSGSAHIIVQ